MTVLNNVWSVTPNVVPTPTAAQLAASTTPDAFSAWPLAVQVTFVKANGTGNPPQVVLGLPGDQGLATLTPTGEVTTEPLPLAFSLPPASIDYDTFKAWSPDVQTAYIQAHVLAGYNGMTLGSAGSTFTATLQGGGQAYDAGHPALGTNVLVAPGSALTASLVAAAPTDPSTLTPDAFFALPQAEQKTIASAHPSPLVLGGGVTTDPVISVTLDDTSTIRLRLPASAYPGFNAPFNTANSTGASVSTVSNFTAWPLEVQKAYLLNAVNQSGLSNQGQPPIAVVFGVTGSADGFTATLLSSQPGAQVAISANPTGFGAALIGVGATPTADVFLSWPAAAQLAYTLAATANQPSFQLGSLTVHRSDQSHGGLTFTVSLSDTTAAAEVDPTLFALATSADQTAYFQHNAVNPLGTLPWLTLGTGANAAVFTQASGGTLVAQAIPPGFQTDPDKLSSTIFLSWPPVIRAQYLVGFGEGDAWSVTFADHLTYGINAANQTELIPPDLIDLGSPGTTQPIPYDSILSASVATTAATLFPSAVANPWKGAAGTAPDVSTFTNWTSAQQAAYIQASTTSTNPTITLGSGASELDAFVSQTTRTGLVPKVYIVQSLQKTDIAGMSYADQKTLASNPAFLASAKGLGLIPDGIASSGSNSTDATNAASAATLVAKLVDSYRTTIVSDPNVPSAAKAVFAAEIDLIGATLFGTAAPVVNDTYVSDVGSDYTYLKVHPGGTNTQFPTLPPTPQTSGSAIFSITDIQTKLDAIQKRFTRLSDFASIATKGGTNDESALTVRDFNGNTYSFVTKNVAALLGQVDGAPWCGSNGAITAYNTPVYIENNVALPNVNVNSIYTSIVASSASNHQAASFPTPLLTLLKTTSDTTNNYAATTGLSFVNISPTYSSADNDATQKSGYLKFLQQETVILNNAASAHQLATSNSTAGTGTTLGLSGTRNLDLPTLLCLYQIYNSNIEQAIVSADSEEVNQVNAVLQEYAAMQSIINATAATATNDANTSVQMQVGNTNPAIVWLFNNYDQGYNSDHVGNMSAIEKLYFSSGFTRPQTDLHLATPNTTGDPYHNQNAKPSYFTDFGTRLSDAVTQLNQQSQIKMNDITSETKQQDRFFDLASTSLTKLNEALSQIASAT